MKKENLFDYSARFGLLSMLLAWGLLALGVGGSKMVILLALSWFTSFLYVWYQLRLKVSGRAYRDDFQGFVLSCALPLVAMSVIPVLYIVYFGVLSKAA